MKYSWQLPAAKYSSVAHRSALGEKQRAALVWCVPKLMGSA
jgi:hypothetical protein